MKFILAILIVLAVSVLAIPTSTSRRTSTPLTTTTTGDKVQSRWCCRVNTDTVEHRSRLVESSHVVATQVRNGTQPCGWLGLSRCSAYYVAYKYITYITEAILHFFVG